MVVVKFEDYKKVMTAENCADKIKALIKLHKDQRIRMATNPYNAGVIRVDTICGDEGELFCWIEHVTPKKQGVITSVADEYIHGRFW
jgi:hypothetical protein